MKLECTKKLLDFMNVKPVKVEEQFDPLFAWTANLITINRRKMLVAVNLDSRCIFVLYGLTVKSILKLPEMIQEGIRTLLRSEYVHPEIIERYLDDCGRMVTFSSNTSRSAVAYCNKACERVKMFSNLFIPGEIYQAKYLPWLNDDLFPKENYTYTHEVMIAKLKQLYGEDIQSCRALELEVELKLDMPCKRRLIVPDDLNFYQLHRILQDAFEWHDCHLHQFVLERDCFDRPVKVLQPSDTMNEPDDLYDVECLDSATVTVGELFARYEKIEYEYDFGDYWLHTIKLCRVLENCSEPYPHCTQAIGDAPMEDSGGAYGFSRIVEILKDSSHPEYGEISAWVQGSWWRPLNVDLINRRLQNTHRRSVPVYYE